MLSKSQIGRVRIERERIWSLAYADDLVLLTKNEESMKKMMKRTERYLREKKLQLHAEKSKILQERRKEVGIKRKQNRKSHRIYISISVMC